MHFKYYQNTYVNTIFLELTTPKEIFSTILPVGDVKSVGINEITVSLLKYTAELTSSSLSVLINHSLNSGTVPHILKTSMLKPIYKDINNYHSISLLSHISKIYEKDIHNTFQNHHFFLNFSLLFSIYCLVKQIIFIVSKIDFTSSASSGV